MTPLLHHESHLRFWDFVLYDLIMLKSCICKIRNSEVSGMNTEKCEVKNIYLSYISEKSATRLQREFLNFNKIKV